MMTRRETDDPVQARVLDGHAGLRIYIPEPSWQRQPKWLDRFMDWWHTIMSKI